MDPLDSILANSDNPQAQVRQATQKEMARRSQDRIIVFNPLDTDYTVRFDSIGFVIPNRNKDDGHGLGRAVVFRYVATNYLTQMIDLILTSRLDEAIRLENEMRASKGMLPMTKFIGGEELTFANSLRTDNLEARRKLIPVIWLGLAERYGTETKEESISGKPKDDRPLDERLLTEVENQPTVMPKTEAKIEEVINTPTQEPVAESTPPQDLTTLNVFSLRKIAKERGIPTKNTDKKTDLLYKLQQTSN